MSEVIWYTYLRNLLQRTSFYKTVSFSKEINTSLYWYKYEQMCCCINIYVGNYTTLLLFVLFVHLFFSSCVLRHFWTYKQITETFQHLMDFFIGTYHDSCEEFHKYTEQVKIENFFSFSDYELKSTSVLIT